MKFFFIAFVGATAYELQIGRLWLRLNHFHYFRLWSSTFPMLTITWCNPDGGAEGSRRLLKI